MTLRRRIGFEVELMAPPGSNRAALAAEIARREHGAVRPVFHVDSEPSLVPGMGTFLHLTPGFEVNDSAGAPIATLVDDITLSVRSDDSGPSDWVRLLSDDIRLLRLVELHVEADRDTGSILEPIAALFGTRVERFGAISRVDDRSGATVVMAAPLAKARERPCEVVTAPISADHANAVDRLLLPARDLGFTVPDEAAVHLHVDGAGFRQVHSFLNLLRMFGWWRDALWLLLGTNPRCIRLAPVPPEALALLDQSWTSWPELQQAAAQTGLQKYADLNLVQLVSPTPIRDTVEIRILPGEIDTDVIVARASIIERILDRCEQTTPIASPKRPAGQQVSELSDLLGLS